MTQNSNDFFDVYYIDDVSFKQAVHDCILGFDYFYAWLEPEADSTAMVI